MVYASLPWVWRISTLGPSSSDVAAWERDAAWTAQLMGEILDNVETIGDFTKSKLYQHMTLKTINPNFSAGLKQKLLESLEDEAFNYMQGNAEWEKLKSP